MNLAIHAERRRRLAEAIGPRACALFVSTPEQTRSNDTHYRYRPSSDLVYLTGFHEPECALLLRPGADKDRAVVFVRPRDPERETWDGRRLGVDHAAAALGVDAAYPIAELPGKLAGLIGNVDDFYFLVGTVQEWDERVCAALATMRMSERRAGRPPKRIVDPRVVLHEMRLHKTQDELDVLAKAALISGEAHVAAMRAGKPGAMEYELEALIEYTFRRRGAIGPGYGTIVGTGRNATILHYVENSEKLQAGELVLIDAGAEVDYYTADVTRTFPCGGKFSPLRRHAYEIVLAAQEEAIRMVRPGITIDQIHDRTVELLTAGMIELGLLKGTVAERIADSAYKKYYMHRTSHWLGMDVHDVGAYSDDGGGARPLDPGMVITIEPGLYVGENDEHAPPELRGVGIRIEDDVLVTADGHRNLTVEIPKRTDEIERIAGS
jgi:Xaa-Pro aminopeptidase